MSDSPTTGEEKSERKINLRLSPLRLLGWVLGGLSLLNLIEELSPLKVLGKLKTWLDAYTSIVNDVGTFLFGWIDLKWIAIDQLEIHVLVIATIVASAYIRAQFSELRSQEKDLFDAIGGVLGGVIVAMWMFFCRRSCCHSGSGWLGQLSWRVLYSCLCYYTKAKGNRALFRRLGSSSESLSASLLSS